MNAQPVQRWHVLLFAVGVFAILVKLAASVDMGDQDVVSFMGLGAKGNHVELQGLVAPRGETRGSTTLEGLPCFGCHELAAYLEGDDFPHVQNHQHLHCHICHSFQGHAETILREDVCGECH